jgi:hypothetical protein
MMGVAGVLGAALLCAIHGATVDLKPWCIWLKEGIGGEREGDFTDNFTVPIKSCT